MKFFKSAQEHGATALKSILGALLLGGLLAGLAPNAQATLIGQTVGCSSSTSVTKCSSVTAVVQSTASEFGVIFFNVRKLWDIDIEESSIRVDLNSAFTNDQRIIGSINVRLSDLFWLGDPDAVITGFSLAVDGVTGFDEAAISFSDNAIGFNLGGSQGFSDWAVGSSATITLLTEGGRPSVSVPEPATLALFGLGLAGLGFARRRKTA